jgi:hypothetical protein
MNDNNQFPQIIETKNLRYIAAGLSVCAGVLHVIIVPEHLEEWWGYGTFFIIAAVAQLFYSLLLVFQPWQPDPIRGPQGLPATYVYWAGIIGNGFLIALYLVTRTIGIPFFGPEAGEVEPVRFIGLMTKVIEALLIVTLIILLRRSKSDMVKGDQLSNKSG